MHYPGKVTLSDGTNSAATCWVDYALAPDVTYGTAQGVVCCGYWVMLDFEIAEMIPLAKQRHEGPHEECV
jgi:hypothetical protein